MIFAELQTLENSSATASSPCHLAFKAGIAFCQALPQIFKS
jgi:hypothetical protein